MSTIALSFREIKDTGKTKAWSVHSPDGTRLGDVSWYSHWRRYVFTPCGGTLFDADCLGSIVAFIMARMKERKA